MSVAHFVDFQGTCRGGSSQPGRCKGRRLTYNALLREGKLRIRDHIRIICPRKNNTSTKKRLTKEISSK